MVAAMINGVAKASRQNDSTQPMNGRTMKAPNRRNGSQSGESTVTFDYLGNPL